MNGYIFWYDQIYVEKRWIWVFQGGYWAKALIPLDYNIFRIEDGCAETSNDDIYHTMLCVENITRCEKHKYVSLFTLPFIDNSDSTKDTIISRLGTS